LKAARATSVTLLVRAALGLEVLTGLGLVVAPSLLSRLLFGSDLNAAGDAAGHLAGLVIICLAAAVWPRGGESTESQALIALAALSWLVSVFLLVFGVWGGSVGLLFWPAAALHFMLALMLTRVRTDASKSGSSP
jgi:hypothetical protein